MLPGLSSDFFLWMPAANRPTLVLPFISRAKILFFVRYSDAIIPQILPKAFFYGLFLGFNPYLCVQMNNSILLMNDE